MNFSYQVSLKICFLFIHTPSNQIRQRIWGDRQRVSLLSIYISASIGKTCIFLYVILSYFLLQIFSTHGQRIKTHKLYLFCEFWSCFRILTDFFLSLFWRFFLTSEQICFSMQLQPLPHSLYLYWAWYNKKDRMKNFTFSVDWFVCNISVKLAGLVSMNSLKQQSNFIQDKNLGHNFFHAKHQQYVSTYANKLQGVRVWGGEFTLQITSWISFFRVSLLFCCWDLYLFLRFTCMKANHGWVNFHIYCI